MTENASNTKLRSFQKSDRKDLAYLCNNKKIWDNLRDYIPHPYTLEDAEYFIQICQKENPQCTFIIEYNGSLAGCIGLVPQTDVYRLSAELGYWIGEPFWGKGIATQAVKMIVDYGFRNLKLIRIYSGVFDYNKASQRVLEKADFKFEGISKNAIFKNGNIHNEYRYGLLKNN